MCAIVSMENSPALEASSLSETAEPLSESSASAPVGPQKMSPSDGKGFLSSRSWKGFRDIKKCGISLLNETIKLDE
jgi:hypothetical protein